MKEFAGLNRHDMELLVGAIESSLMIKKRSQFYLWTQGALQGFIPHETLLCAYGDIARMRFKYETFSGALTDMHPQHEVADPVSGLLPRIVGDWLSSGCVPQLFCGNSDTPGHASARSDQHKKLLNDLKRCDFGHVTAHGAKEIQGEFGSFFVFAGVPESPTARDIYMLELLMPYLHMALHRMLANEVRKQSTEVSAESLLTKREIQVLQWVKNGKTNQEIGQILDISPPTVKNHVQKILRKLQVSNRAQAVGKSATLRLFTPTESV